MKTDPGVEYSLGRLVQDLVFNFFLPSLVLLFIYYTSPSIRDKISMKFSKFFCVSGLLSQVAATKIHKEPSLCQKLEVGSFNVNFRATNETYELARCKLTRMDLKNKRMIWDMPRRIKRT